MAKMKFIKNPNTQAQAELASQIWDEWNAAVMTRQNLGIEDEWVDAEKHWANDAAGSLDPDEPGSNVNIIQPTIESQVSDLVEEDFAISVKGESRSDQMYIDKAQSMLVWTWEQNDMVPKVDSFERDRLKLGTGIWKVRYNSEKGFNGLVEILNLPIESVGIDPKITNYIEMQDADYIIHAKPVSLNYLRRRFGKKGKAVLPEPTMSGFGLTDDQAVGIADVVNNKAILYERWTKEYDEKSEETVLRLVYMANDIILYDSMNPKDEMKDEPTESFYKHRMYPFVLVPCYKRSDSVYGISDSKYLIPIQNMINDLDDQIRYNARLTGNVQVVVGMASGINPSTWTPTPGLRIPARDPSAFKTVVPPPLPNYIAERRIQGLREAELVSGRPDVVEGRSSGGVDSAAAIMALQEAGNKRIKHKKKMSSAGFKQLLKLVYEFCVEFYDEEQEFPTKDSKGRDEFTWFNGSELATIPQLVPEVDEETGYTSGWTEKIIDDEVVTKKAQFQFSINIGQGLPNNHAFIYQSVIEMKHADMITREEGRTILQRILGYTGFNPLSPVGAFDGPANKQFGQAGAANMNTGAGLGQLTQGTPLPMPSPQSPPQAPGMPMPQQAPGMQGQQDPGMMLTQIMQGIEAGQIDPNNPEVKSILAALMQAVQGGQGGMPNEQPIS